MTCPKPHRQQDEYVCPDCGLRWDFREEVPPCGLARPVEKPSGPIVVGICGAAGSGKSTVASHLVNNHGFVVMKFADTLKDMTRVLLYDMGFDEDVTEAMIEGDLKEHPIDGIDASPRRIMQTLGSDWGRDMIHPEVWTRIWSERVTTVLREDPTARIVADDVRFVNEVDAVRRMGGQVAHIYRDDLPIVEAHQSENGAPSWEIGYRNDGTLVDLAEWVDRVLVT